MHIERLCHDQEPVGQLAEDIKQVQKYICDT